MERRIHIIANPVAGKGRSIPFLKEVEEVLVSAGVTYKVSMTQRPGDGIQLARKAASDGWPIVAGLGGDGTIHEVLNGIVGSSCVLGILPGGTGNDHARSLGVPLTPKESAEILLSAEPQAIDIGAETDRFFGVVAAVGFPVDVMEHTNRKRKLIRGPLAIAASVFQTIYELRPHHYQLLIDGEEREFKGVGLFVLNCRFTGGGMMMAPEARPNDGFLDLVIVREIGRMDLLTTLPKTYSGRHVGHPKIDFMRVRELEVRGVDQAKMFDGDVVGRTPMKVKVLPKALKVLGGEF